MTITEIDENEFQDNFHKIVEAIKKKKEEDKDKPLEKPKVSKPRITPEGVFFDEPVVELFSDWNQPPQLPNIPEEEKESS